MNSNELKESLRNIIISHPKSYALVLKSKKNKEILDFIINSTKHILDIDFNTRIYWTLNDIKAFPVCNICGKNEIPHNRKCHPLNGYISFACSQSCAQKNPEYRKQLEEKNLKKYGVKYVQQTSKFKNKLKNILTNLSEQHWKNANIKRKNTCLEKYGVDNISKNSEIHQKAVNSLNIAFNKNKNEILQKTKTTKLKKYGNQNFVNSKKAQETIQKNLKNNPFYYDISNKKRKETCLEKYGVQYACNTDNAKIQAVISRKTKLYNSIIKNNNDTTALFSLDDFLNSNNEKLCWKCNKCGNIFESYVYEHQHFVARCLHCYPLKSSTSNIEKTIANFIKKLNFNVICSSRKIISPQELDIYIPEKKLAIEFDGLYWHSSNLNTLNTYHLNKTNKCEKQGIQLIHIFENEWLTKQDIVKSRIKNLLGIYNKTIFARKCEVKEIDVNASKQFQEENHLQGAVNSKISLGLYHNNELISLMTFGKCRFDRKHEWEMLRFCNKLGYHIPGAAGKLLKYFEKNYKPKSLVSYADRRWSRGKLYKQLGFNLNHISQPNYWYWNYKNFNGILQSRIKFQKHKLKNILKNFDDTLSEYENMRNNGYMRIFDCGNLVFEKIY